MLVQLLKNKKLLSFLLCYHAYNIVRNNTKNAN